MSYSEYGLDNEKKTHDPGTVGNKFCPWCDSNKRKGFYMCFAHFIICPDCIEKGLRYFATSRFFSYDDCFKCSKVGDVFSSTGSTSICKDCLEWGKDVLNKTQL